MGKRKRHDCPRCGRCLLYDSNDLLQLKELGANVVEVMCPSCQNRLVQDFDKDKGPIPELVT